MAVELEGAPDRPRTYFAVGQRLLRGYGPLAGFVVVMIVMSMLVPSKVHKVSAAADNAAAEASDSSDTTVAGATDAASAENAAVGATVKTPGGGTAAVTRCAGDQVVGDPYSPPCVQFSGSNGGATHHGVTAKEIHVAYRVLNEKGFQQTLAALAGASLTDTPDDI